MPDNHKYPYSEVPENWDKYDALVDYCGPNGQWYSRFIPRDICGLDGNKIYYAHDQRYRLGKTRKDKRLADRQMLKDQKILIRMVLPWWRPLRYRALINGRVRYQMVSWFGDKAFDKKGEDR